MRVVYLFASVGRASIESVPWNFAHTTSHPLMGEHLLDEGMFYLWDRLTHVGVIHDLLIVVESAHDPGYRRYTDHIEGLVVPKIEEIKPLIEKDDVIFARGGFKGWYDSLAEWSKTHWIPFYRAATNRGNWPFWDVTLDDLIDAPLVDDGNRLHIPFIKPTNPLFFHPIQCKRDIDVCIGASNISDKKGQWRGLRTVLEHDRIYGTALKCVMPGAHHRGVHTSEIPQLIDTHGLDVDMPGNVSRKNLATLMNRSNVFLHLGNPGQNDRSILEAMACGCPIVIADVKGHPPYVKANPAVATVVPQDNDWGTMAERLHEALTRSVEERREYVFRYQDTYSNIEQVCIPQMRHLFEFLFQNPLKDKEALRVHYGIGMS